ncbi:SNF2 family N-terminal domain containing protein [Coccidioides posadasii C735 delta SOWgp]|uniref:SNF2 family N-terminal domain containing protein n=1 Tax=Coccidioides posadasii (strain C735) TaxID=222929 RepID=C5PGD1_COCP7|nr:SNF2 family N-terminal domain containing protein [Coccidioides posadasii C735 delta SOWgp]EER23584.1 SNF2 family N-terminal domain containing protein [Coccidioides posadasii C735 delta SOWgp]|eukprot:XP_003065729.1 SNF2 family N-terminal domain containing protein [Coccidioides posadasii C735 delta SOWgp]
MEFSLDGAVGQNLADEPHGAEFSELQFAIAESPKNEKPDDPSDDSSPPVHLASAFSSAPKSAISTPSSKSSCPPPPSRPPTKKELLLNNLDNFIPVGILKVFDPSSVTRSKDTDFLLAEVNKLLQAGWVRTSIYEDGNYPGWKAIRIYVLPEDVGRSIIQRSSTAFRRSLRVVMSRLDTSPEAWTGNFDPLAEHSVNSKTEDESLFYIFNTLESPNPNVDSVPDFWARLAMASALKGNSDSDAGKNVGIRGLKTPLYPYQRRSVAFMIQKESEPGEYPDPRLQAFKGPTGRTYYYDREEGAITRDQRLYSGPCGGVLAETMGYGKTLICLAVILATKGYFPRIPSTHLQELHPVRAKTGSLFEMTASAVGRFSVPWKSYFEHLNDLGMHYVNCTRACEHSQGSYTVIQAPKSSNRMGIKSSYLRLASGTLVIVPPNLVDHWLHEIEKHTEGLKVLVLRDVSDRLPPADELLQYDIVLFARSRFEKEKAGFEHHWAIYDSPLKELHWLRIIVDEGHNFASSGGKSNAIHFLEMLHVERRWVVSGTPSDGMYGVEVSLASQETLPEMAMKDDERAAGILKSRKDASGIIDEELKNLDRLKRIVIDFLRLKPWANSRAQDPANWSKYMTPKGVDGKRTMATSLRSTLQSIVVRHRTEDINKDLVLPNLSNKVVYLEPTFHDKLSLNMFIFHLVVNAITSERTDRDYMFHPRNRKHLATLINNLRYAGFWWTGFDRKDVEVTLDVARKYLAANVDRMTRSDLDLLCEGIHIAEKTISCPSWNAFSQFDELGVFIRNFPEYARPMWSLDDSEEHQEPLLLGISQARDAQRFITARLCAENPAEGIAGAGIKTKREMRRRLDNPTDLKSQRGSPTKPQAESAASNAKTNDYLIHRPRPEKLPKAQKFSRFKTLPAESPLAKAQVVATTSAKLSYLLDRVFELQSEEKIIIFYENNNNAFWVAEGLEMLGVEFRIYASTLKPKLKAEYLALFNNSECVRVLLMDLRQASHGLHLASASRIFIINPIWDPNIESQAIKRAHRISQMKPVYVETLVLKDTLEDKMLRRRKQMTNIEMQHAEKDLLDDRTMSSIIKEEGFIPVSEDEKDSESAYMKNKPGFFDRHKMPIPDNFNDKKPPRPVIQPSPRRRTPAKGNNKVSEPMPFLDSDVTPGSGRGNKRQITTTEEVVTDDGIVMMAPRTPGPRKRRATSHLTYSNAGNNENAVSSNGESSSPVLDISDISGVFSTVHATSGPNNSLEDPFLAPDQPIVSASFFLSAPAN